MKHQEFELTDEEKQLVMLYRENKLERVREEIKKQTEEFLSFQRNKATLHILDISAAYAKWMKEEGVVGYSFSTFCDDFGYIPDGLMQRIQVYEAVIRVIHAAREHAEKSIAIT